MSKKNMSVFVLVIIVAGGIVMAVRDRDTNGSETKLPTFLDEAIKSSGVTVDARARYVHTDGSFSFIYPEGFTPKVQSDGEEGEVVVVENGEVGVQIAIVPFDEDSALTPERIKVDLPDLVMERTEIMHVGGVQAVAFQSTNASTAASNEVWFVHDKTLYLMSSPAGSDALVSGILTSWKF